MFGRPWQINQRIRKTNLANETDHLVIPLNNVYEPLDVDFHKESSNEHDESTLEETETQRNTNWSKSNSMQRSIADRIKPRALHNRKVYRKPVWNTKRKIVPGNRSYANTTGDGKKYL